MCDKYKDPFREIAADIARDIFQDGYDPCLAIEDMLEELVTKIANFAEEEKKNRCEDIDFAVEQLKEIAIKVNK